MAAPDRPDAPRPGGTSSRVERLIWFVAIWVASVSALGVVAYGIRAMVL